MILGRFELMKSFEKKCLPSKNWIRSNRLVPNWFIFRFESTLGPKFEIDKQPERAPLRKRVLIRDPYVRGLTASNKQ